MQHEFEEMVKEKTGKTPTLTREAWSVIQYVYSWHPSISDVSGKKEIVDIWQKGGIQAIVEMIPCATATRTQIDTIEKVRDSFYAAQAKKKDELNKLKLERKLLDEQMAGISLDLVDMAKSYQDEIDTIKGVSLFNLDDLT